MPLEPSEDHLSHYHVRAVHGPIKQELALRRKKFIKYCRKPLQIAVPVGPHIALQCAVIGG